MTWSMRAPGHFRLRFRCEPPRAGADYQTPSAIIGGGISLKLLVGLGSIGYSYNSVDLPSIAPTYNSHLPVGLHT